MIWLCLIGLAMYWAWLDFNNATTISGGGYLYNDNGEVIGNWDKWDLANYPHWMFPIWLIAYLFTGMPMWWIVAFWSIGMYLGYLFWFIYRPCISLE